jgi:hypothetical protein
MDVLQDDEEIVLSLIVHPSVEPEGFVEMGCVSGALQNLVVGQKLEKGYWPVLVLALVHNHQALLNRQHTSDLLPMTAYFLT